MVCKYVCMNVIDKVISHCTFMCYLGIELSQPSFFFFFLVEGGSLSLESAAG